MAEKSLFVRPVIAMVSWNKMQNIVLFRYDFNEPCAINLCA